MKKAEIQAFILATNDDEDVKRHIPKADLLSADDWKVLAIEYEKKVTKGTAKMQRDWPERARIQFEILKQE